MYRHLLIKVNSKELFQFLRVQFHVSPNVLTYEFSKNFAMCILQNLQKTINLQIILILMKDYGLEDSKQMEQVRGLYVGTGFYI